MPLKALSRDGSQIEVGRVTKVLAFRGLERVPVEEAEAGRHCCHRRSVQGNGCRYALRSAVTEALQARPIDPPTTAMHRSLPSTFQQHGTEGDKVTSRCP